MAAVGRAAVLLVALSMSTVVSPSARGANGDDPPSARVGAESSVGTPVIGVAPSEQSNSAIAAGAGEFLAVWRDERKCCSPMIYGARLDLEGRILDPVGIPISEHNASYDTPDVTWDGSNYLVVWESLSEGIRAARVSPEGDVLDRPSLRVADFDHTGGAEFEPAVATAGGRSMVVWTGYRGGDPGMGIHAAFVAGDGDVSDSFVLVDARFRQDMPDVAGGDGGYVVTWRSMRDNSGDGLWRLRMMAVNEDGAARTRARTLAAKTYDDDALVAFSGGSFLVVWEPTYGDGNVLGARVGPSGELLDPHPITIVPEDVRRASAAVTADGEGGWALVLYGPEYRLHGSRVTAGGTVPNPEGTLLVDRDESQAVPYPQPAVAFSGGRATLLWTRFPVAYEDPYDKEDVFALSGDFDELGSAEQRVVTTAPNTQVGPSIAWNGEVFLVAWADAREHRVNPAVYVTRVTPTGEVLDGSGILITPEGLSAAEPSVASDGTGFLVAWRLIDTELGDGADVYATRVSSQGDVLDDSPIAVSTAPRTQWGIDSAWTGDSYLLTWEDTRTEDEVHADEYSKHDGSDIYGARVTTGGDVLDPDGVPLAENKRDEAHAEVAAGPGGGVIVWRRWCLPEGKRPCTYDVLGRRVDELGRPAGEVLKIGTSSDHHELAPSVTATDAGFLAAWTSYAKDSYAIELREIGAAGALGPSKVLGLSAVPQDSPAIDWAGGFATLAWDANGECLECGGDVVALRVSASGDPIDDAPTPIASEETDEMIDEVASTGLGCSFLAYERDDAGLMFGITRSFVRSFGDC
jgi:hypothetical protein